MAKVRGGRGPIAGLELLRRLSDEPLEFEHVDRLGRRLQLVARLAGHDDGRIEHLAQLGDIDLNRVRRSPWRVVAPQQVDQSIGRNNLPTMHGKDREDSPLFAWSKSRRPVVGHDLEIPQQMDLHLRP